MAFLNTRPTKGTEALAGGGRTAVGHSGGDNGGGGDDEEEEGEDTRQLEQADRRVYAAAQRLFHERLRRFGLSTPVAGSASCHLPRQAA